MSRSQKEANRTSRFLQPILDHAEDISRKHVLETSMQSKSRLGIGRCSDVKTDCDLRNSGGHSAYADEDGMKRSTSLPSSQFAEQYRVM